MTDIQYLTFFIGDEVFALDVLKIDEIIPYDDITYIPRMQPYIMGVMNIRGKIIPIVSLNKRLDLNLPMDSKKQSIIIISLTYEDEKHEVGVVVSKVDKVYTLIKEYIEPSPAFGSKIDKKFIKNIASFDDKFISIIDIDEVLNLKELSTTTQEIE